MTSTRRGRGASQPALLLLALLLAGCSFADETIRPTRSGGNARGAGTAREATAARIARGAPPAAAGDETDVSPPGEERPPAAAAAAGDPVAGDLARVESQLAARRAEL